MRASPRLHTNVYIKILYTNSVSYLPWRSAVLFLLESPASPQVADGLQESNQTQPTENVTTWLIWLNASVKWNTNWILFHLKSRSIAMFFAYLQEEILFSMILPLFSVSDNLSITERKIISNQKNFWSSILGVFLLLLAFLYSWCHSEKDMKLNWYGTEFQFSHSLWQIGKKSIERKEENTLRQTKKNSIGKYFDYSRFSWNNFFFFLFSYSSWLLRLLALWQLDVDEVFLF